MAGKVKVSLDVANFIQGYEDNVRGFPGWADSLIYEHSQAWFNNFEGSKIGAKCMKDITPFQLASILTRGHEVEQTPEEKVKRYFENWNIPTDGISNSDWTSEQKAIIGTLNRLNIKIEGVNE